MNLNAQPVKSYADHSVLSQGEWTRWAVGSTGIQKITYEQLQAAGLSLPAPGSQIKVYGNGGGMLPENTSDPRMDDLAEVACLVEDQGDSLLNAPGDYLLFYATGPVIWAYNPLLSRFQHQLNFYNDESYYFITVSENPGKRILPDTLITAAADLQLSVFQDHVFHENDEVNLLKSGKIWYGERFPGSSEQTFNFSFPEISDTDSVFICSSFSARSGDTSYFELSAWGQAAEIMLMKVDGSVNADFVKSGQIKILVKPDGDECQVKISYTTDDQNASAWLNDIEVTARRALHFTGGQLAFRNSLSLVSGVLQYNLSGLNTSCTLWNVTDPWNVKNITMAPSADGGWFKRQGGLLEEFILFDGTSFHTPSFVENVANQDLHASGFPGFVIVTPPAFKVQADRLAAFHSSNDAMVVQVVELQTIYNEFSSGMQDPSAIRDYLRMLYLKAGSEANNKPQYLLLFGDGSYDMKNRITPNSNFVPTYQTMNSALPTSSFVSDDFFGLLDDNEGVNAGGLVDIGIGRLPVSTADEARMMVDKILRYSSPVDLLPSADGSVSGQVSNFDGWRNMITFIADDEDGNLHLRQAETLCGITDSLTTGFNFSKIYLDAYQQEETPSGDRYPGAEHELMKQVTEGSLIINYTGHGGETGLADEKIFEISDVTDWTNYFNLPVLVTATCEFSRYDNPAEKSAGEYLLLSPVGGVIAMLSTTRVAYAHSNMTMNTNLLQATFEPGASQRLGDMVRLGKVRSGAGVYMQNFTLLGDPAMKLAVPKHKVLVDALNGEPLNPGQDTLRAGSQVTIAGYVADSNQQVMLDFNGEVSCVMFDKLAEVTTMANDQNSISQVFTEQSSVIFKGRASVTQGRFIFSFTLPVDVSFRDGNARLSFYANAIHADAQGAYDQFVLFNDGESVMGDNQGPEIQLFMNDRGFRNDGITAADVSFIADLKDVDGINFYGEGFGHDILMVMDDDFVNPLVMNPWFSAEIDNSGMGSLKYPISDLSEGAHKIWLRCWDVLNYSAEKELNFIVKETGELSLNHVKVSPNPVTDHADFCYDRNKTDQAEWAELIIRTTDGKTICDKEARLDPGAGISLCLTWDGAAANGQEAPAGLYIYTLKITDETGGYKQFTGLLAKVE